MRLVPAAALVTTALMSWAAADPARWSWFVGLAAVQAGWVGLAWYGDRLSTRAVFVTAVLLRLVLLPLPPVLSDDAYRYVWDGLLQVEGLNPFRWTPEAVRAVLPSAPYDALNSASFYSVYPPVSQLLFAAGAWVGGTPDGTYYAVKSMLLLAEVAGLGLLARMVPARRLLLYAWHPLVLVEVAGQAHTEAAMVGLLLAALFAWPKRPAAAAAWWTAAVWVKLYPLLVLPFVVRRAGRRSLIVIGLVSAALLAPYAQPDVPAKVMSSLALYVRYFEFNAGPYYAAKAVLRLLTGEDWSKTLGPLFQIGLAVTLAALFAWPRVRRWSLARVAVWCFGAVLVWATTVHPWYLLSVLPLLALCPRPGWHWQWLGLASMGTYLLYVEGPYWAFVIAGWTGWAVLAAWRVRPAAWAALMRHRARAKVRAVRRYLPDDLRGVRVLDLGAGEGYVGEALARRDGAEVTLMDVLDLNRTALPHRVYDGRTVPLPDDAVDYVLLYFVLHHCEDPDRVMAEALRVAREGVVVAESVYVGAWDRRLLTVLDVWANRLRSAGAMRPGEEHLHFRTAEGWAARWAARGARVAARHRAGRVVHRRAYYLVKPVIAS